MNKEKLLFDLAKDLHNMWCTEELKSYHQRLSRAYNNTKKVGSAINDACYQYGRKRNDYKIDNLYIISIHNKSFFNDFDEFMYLVNHGIIVIKRYVKRNLTEVEKNLSYIDYVDGEENILTEYEHLSEISKQEYLEASKLVLSLVYDKVMNDEEIMDEELERYSSIVHEEWLKRNELVFDRNNGNPYLAVPYNELSESYKDKDRNQLRTAITKIKQYKENKQKKIKK